MALENILSMEVERLEASARNMGVSALSGFDSLELDDKPRRRSIGETVFKDGDVLTVPPLPVKGEPKDTDSLWKALPISAGGDPILRVVCSCYNTESKKTTAKQLFAGTLSKSLMNRDTLVETPVTGTIVAYLADCVTNTQVWNKIAGHKLHFVSHTDVPYVQIGFNGAPDRNKTGSVFEINIEE